jgi:hypothetical protein
MRDAFIDPGSKYYNTDHAHLTMASIGVLWTNEPNERQMNKVVGTAEVVKAPTSMGKWQKERFLYQIRQWFGYKPDFLITLYAPYCAEADHWSFCALAEHELYHCALLRFTNMGMPVWTIKGHDVEEHVGVVERYGVGAAAGKTKQLVEAAKKKPLMGRAQIQGLCGSEPCLKAA